MGFIIIFFLSRLQHRLHWWVSEANSSCWWSQTAAGRSAIGHRGLLLKGRKEIPGNDNGDLLVSESEFTERWMSWRWMSFTDSESDSECTVAAGWASHGGMRISKWSSSLAGRVSGSAGLRLNSETRHGPGQLFRSITCNNFECYTTITSYSNLKLLH